MPTTLAAELDAAFSSLDPVERLRLLRRRIAGRLVFTSSFGLEDQALTHLIAQSGIEADVVTLDTGRLFPETYDVWTGTEARYRRPIRAVAPDTSEVEALVARQGIDGFTRSKDARLACCAVRKLHPLARALQGASAWITGLRADQADTRQGLPYVSHDPAHDLLKANPLLDCTRERLAALVATEQVPINALHAQGYPSIGCAPCTRAVRPGEPERAGRWWWETDNERECGLHVGADGRLVRASVGKGAPA